MNKDFVVEDLLVCCAKNKNKSDKPETAKTGDKSKNNDSKGKNNDSKGKNSSSSKKEESKSRANDKNLNAIGKSSAEDCCACVKVLSEYIKEIIKLICCASNGDYEDPETRFTTLFCQLGEITIRLGHDVFNLLKLTLISLHKFLSSNKNKK